MRHAMVLAVILFVAPSSTSAQELAAPPAPPREATIMPLVSLRVAPGAAAYAAPRSAFNFDFDLMAGFRLGILTDELWTAPLIELGYSYHAGDSSQGEGDYFVLGAGLSIGSLEVAATLVPAYVVGDSDGDLVHGVRTAARLDLWLGVWSVEVAYEWRSVRASDAHSARLTLALDFGLIASWLARSFAGSPAQREPPSE